MNRKQYILLVALTVVAGLAGGAVSDWVFMAGTAVAEDAEKHEKVITAEEFRLVDGEGKTRGKFAISPTGYPGVTLFDTNGLVRMRLRVSREPPEDKETLELLKMIDRTDPGATPRRLMLSRLAPEMARLTFYEEDGQPRIETLETGFFAYKDGETPRPQGGAS